MIESASRRDQAKNMLMSTGSVSERTAESSNQRVKKREFYQQRVKGVQHNGKKLWNVLNDIMGRRPFYSLPYCSL